ncbi:MAG: hypothetical protein RBR74_10725 [Ignavibacteriaceae bacterium]|jgi:hypothetical protein|nr:hypothetical protein [Ignavibacteriaceae bacterium]
MSDQHSNPEFGTPSSVKDAENKSVNQNEYPEQFDRIIKLKGKLIVYLSIIYGAIIFLALVYLSLN